MTSVDGGDICSFYIDISLVMILYFLGMCLRFDLYFFWAYGWFRRILCAEGVLEGRVLSKRAFYRVSLNHISLWYDLRP